MKFVEKIIVFVWFDVMIKYIKYYSPVIANYMYLTFEGFS